LKKILLLLFSLLLAGKVWATDYTQDANAVGCYLMTEGTGTTVDDASANSNTLNFKGTGEPSWQSTTPNPPAAYEPYYLEFDDVNDYAQVTDHASLDVTNVSIATWFYRTNNRKYSHIISRWSAYMITIDDDAPVGNNSTNQIKGSVWISTVGKSTYTADNAFSDSTWVHTAMTYNGTIMRLYVNGVDVANSGSSFSGNIDASNTVVRFGLYQGGGTDYQFGGDIGESGVFGRTLSSTEINEIMDYGLKPSATYSGWVNIIRI